MELGASYDDDVYAWSLEQAAVLRRLAEMRRDLPNGLDLANIAEEIEDVGKTELHRVESFLELMLQHLLKLASVPEAQSARHWRQEIGVHHRAVLDEDRRSMSQRVKLDNVWLAAKARADAALDQHGDVPITPLPEACPFSLDDLSADRFDVDAALGRLRAVRPPA